MCIEKRYKRPVRKVYDPACAWIDCAHTDIEPGTIVLVTASWGPFRAIETEDGKQRGTCGKGSLRAVRS